MESARLRRIVFRVFLLAELPVSLLLHSPPLPGWLCRVASPLGAAATLLLAAAAYYVHSLYPRRHDRPSDFPHLLTDGPYRYVRHPFYTCFLPMGYTIPLWTCSVPGIAFNTLVMLPLWHLLARKEEAELLEYWGEEYRRFMETRGMFLPRIH